MQTLVAMELKCAQRVCMDFTLQSEMSDKSNMDESSGADKRFRFIADSVLKTLRLKKDHWQKCVSVEEQKQVIQDFLDKPDHTTLVVYLNTSGQLVPANGFEEISKTKAVYLIKQSQTTLSFDTMKADLMYGDMSYSPMGLLSAFVQEVRKSFEVRYFLSAPYAFSVMYVKWPFSDTWTG